MIASAIMLGSRPRGDHDLRAGGHERVRQRLCIEDIEARRGRPESTQRFGARRRAGRAGDLMAGSEQERQQPFADGAGRASEKNPVTHVHGPSQAVDLDLPAPTT
jgi:hypothetical protein